MKSFEVVSSWVSVRQINDYDDDDAEIVRVKNGKFNVYCEPYKNLYVIHSDWFDSNKQSDLVTKNLLDMLKDQHWVKKGKISLERGYIGVIEPTHSPEEQKSFDAFYWRCSRKLNDKTTYVTKRGVVVTSRQGDNEFFVLQNTNGETIGIKISLEDCGDLSDDEEVYSSDEEKTSDEEKYSSDEEEASDDEEVYSSDEEEASDEEKVSSSDEK